MDFKRFFYIVFMLSKKTKEADIEKNRSTLLLLSFVVVLGILYICIEWVNQDSDPYEYEIFYSKPIEEDTIVISLRDLLPPPPKPKEKIITEIKIVDQPTDSVDLALFNSETEEDSITKLPTDILSDTEDDVVYQWVTKDPQFPGGMPALYKYLSQNISYPKKALLAKIQGQVVCQFIINKDGSVVDIVILRGVNDELNNEALRVIKAMPKWIPAEKDNKKVRVRFTLPIIFALE